MARTDQANPSNVPGPWFVDTRCIRCDAARNWAPGLIEMDADGRSYVFRQPVDAEEEASLWRAAMACPTKSIGSRQHPREEAGVFPHLLTDGVFGLRNNALSSFAAHSFLLVRSEGNLMIDSPRFTRSLAKSIDDLGGLAHVLLTHRDDVADADRWAERYGARVWIGKDDADAAPYATDLTIDAGATVVSSGVASIPTPGHTKGHVVYHVDERFLFTGDTLPLEPRRGDWTYSPTRPSFRGQSWRIPSTN